MAADRSRDREASASGWEWSPQARQGPAPPRGPEQDKVKSSTRKRRELYVQNKRGPGGGAMAAQTAGEHTPCGAPGAGGGGVAQERRAGGDRGQVWVWPQGGDPVLAAGGPAAAASRRGTWDLGRACGQDSAGEPGREAACGFTGNEQPGAGGEPLS